MKPETPRRYKLDGLGCASVDSATSVLSRYRGQGALEEGASKLELEASARPGRSFSLRASSAAKA